MPLKDFLDYVANHPQETVMWDLGGEVGAYKGRMVITTKHSTNPQIRDYRDIEIIIGPGVSYPSVCSADEESPFSRTHTIRDNKIVSLEAA